MNITYIINKVFHSKVICKSKYQSVVAFSHLEIAKRDTKINLVFASN